MDRRTFIKGSAASAVVAWAVGGCREKPFAEHPDMAYRPLGRTGLRVSVIGFGTEWMERQSDETCAAIMRRCEARGINLFDCWMGGPAVRSRIGKALRGHRHQWIIQGHVGCVWKNGQNTRTRDLALCRPAFEELLTRFQTDYIDIGMIHYIDTLEEWESVSKGPFMAYMKELLAAGKIRHIGLSTHNPLVGQAAVKSGLVEMLMFSINPAYDLLPPIDEFMSYYQGDERYDKDLGGIAPERAELYRLCEEKGVGITVMKAYAGGRLFDAQRSPFKTALTPVQCIHYALTRPGVAAVLPGYDTVEHVDAAAAYCQASAEARDYASVLAKAPRCAFDGACTYCGHCSPCIKKIDVAMVNKLYDLAVTQPSVPDSVRQHYLALRHHASECKACDQCEKRCPFHVKIVERMQKAAALFGV